MKKFILVTGNVNKIKEMEKAFGEKIEHINIDLDEIQGMDTEIIASHKATQAWEIVKQPIVVWDHAIYISCLNNFPGPLIKWFWETVTLEKICTIAALLKDNMISSKTTLTYYDGKELKHFHGQTNGTIPTEPRGKNGYGWDPIFIPEGLTITNSEMDDNDPRLHEFQRIAVAKLKNYLQEM